MPGEAERGFDQEARELYAVRRRCPRCRNLVSLFDELIGHCPHCVGVLQMSPDVDPAEMLRKLQARRVELGLEE